MSFTFVANIFRQSVVIAFGDCMAVPQQQQPIYVSTTNEIPGFKIVRYVGLVFGITVRSRGMGGQCLGGCQSTCGGEVSAFTTTAIETRNEAISRMLNDAYRLGANAVIGLSFDSETISVGQGASSGSAVVCYGTAVVVATH